jgi:hypothetical protein
MMEEVSIIPIGIIEYSASVSRNVKKEDFDSYTSELEDIIRRIRRRFPAMVIVGDFNVKSMA